MPRQSQSRPIHLGVFLAALASLWGASQARAEDAPGGYAPGGYAPGGYAPGGYAPGGQAPAPAFVPPAYYLLQDGARLRDSQGRPLSFPDPISAAIALERHAVASPGVPHGIELTSRWTLTYPPSEPEQKPDVFNPAALRDATLRWDPPAERANGDPLSPAELWGYVVMISPSGEGGAEPQVLDIPGASTTRAALRLPPGRYRFSVMAVDTDGRRSSPADPVTGDLT